MLISIDELDSIWCPMSIMGSTKSSFNRTIDTNRKAQGAIGTSCLGPKCALWNWLPKGSFHSFGEGKSADLYSQGWILVGPDPVREGRLVYYMEDKKENLGWCGLGKEPT